MDLVEFLRARLDEDERAAQAVPELGHNFDMGGNRQDERFTHGRTLPSSADGLGNWSDYRDSPTTGAHFSRWEPSRVLAEVEAKRRIIERIEALAAHNRVMPSRDIAMIIDGIVTDLALPYADHPDYNPDWR